MSSGSQVIPENHTDVYVFQFREKVRALEEKEIEDQSGQLK